MDRMWRVSRPQKHKPSIRRTQWPIFMKLGMWVVLGTSVTHVVCRHRMHILNSSFAYLFWLANNTKANIQSSIWATLMKLGMWIVLGTSVIHMVCRHQMRTLNSSFAYLFWFSYNNKGKYPEFYLGYSDETWYVGSARHKCYPRGLSSPNAHIK